MQFFKEREILVPRVHDQDLPVAERINSLIDKTGQQQKKRR